MRSFEILKNYNNCKIRFVPFVRDQRHARIVLVAMAVLFYTFVVP